MRKYLLLLLLTATTSLAWAQMPTDFSRVKVSELSDEQIRDILKQGEAKGLNVTDGESLALSMGLPATEAAAFKARVESLNQKGLPSSTRTVVDPDTTRNKFKPTAVVAKPEKETELGGIATATREVYGRGLYRTSNVELTSQATESKAPDNYVLGPGDELVVSVFGTSYANEVLRIDNKGVAKVRAMGNLYLTGLSFEAARKLIRAKFSQYYDLNNNQLEVTLVHSRVIRVNVVGDVVSPGTYEFSALNSVFNALVAAGGPDTTGSVRQIEVQRAGKVVYRFDTYEFLAGKLSNQPFSLTDQDYIVVKPLGNVVEIQGAVRRTGLYEVLPNENMTQALAWAGGLSGRAYAGSIQRNTFVGGARTVVEYDLQAGQGLTDNLRDGDEILVRSMPAAVRNALEVVGEVNQPGNYTFEAGMKVSSLLQRAGGLPPTAYGQKAFLSRQQADLRRDLLPINLTEILADTTAAANLLLQANDKLIVVSKSSLVDTFAIEVIGAVRQPGTIEFANGIKLGDVLLQAGGVKVEADVKRIEIIRLALFDTQVKTGARSFVVSIDVNKGELSGNDLNIALMPYDRVYVRTLADFLAPATVTLSGEFNFPGVYALLSREERIADLISRAGGLKPYAFAEAARFYRATAPGGQVLMDLEKAINNKSSRNNYRLTDGDSLVVPELIPYVSIQGQGVQYLNTTGLNAVNAPYRPGLRAHRYVRDFGDGFSLQAHKKRLFVVAANDRVSRTRSFLGMRLYPKVSQGAVIYVLEKPVAKGREKGEPINWNKVIDNTTVKLTGLATLYLIFSQVAAR
jgi:protein involved in polysaccharide export with SLBB domain